MIQAQTSSCVLFPSELRIPLNRTDTLVQESVHPGGKGEEREGEGWMKGEGVVG